jgi:hypothetical protein
MPLKVAGQLSSYLMLQDQGCHSCPGGSNRTMGARIVPVGAASRPAGLLVCVIKI